MLCYHSVRRRAHYFLSVLVVSQPDQQGLPWFQSPHTDLEHTGPDSRRGLLFLTSRPPDSTRPVSFQESQLGFFARHVDLRLYSKRQPLTGSLSFLVFCHFARAFDNNQRCVRTSNSRTRTLTSPRVQALRNETSTAFSPRHSPVKYSFSGS